MTHLTEEQIRAIVRDEVTKMHQASIDLVLKHAANQVAARLDQKTAFHHNADSVPEAPATLEKAPSSD